MTSLIPWRKKRNSEVRNADNGLPFWQDRFFTDPFSRLSDLVSNNSSWWPATDIREGKNKITVEAELPGMDKDDLDVSINGRRLNIKGEKSHENETTEKGLYRQERSYGYFNRTVELPAEVDESSITATYKKGVLKVEMKKTKEEQERAIPVKTGGK
ncbi:MAG: Hsp20/alpha crystallin family protein [Desulfosudaceae bacterium]